MRKCSLVFVSLAVVLICGFVLPNVFGWNQHRDHADQVQKVLASSLKLTDGRDRFSQQQWDDYVKLYSYYPDWGAGGLTSSPRDEELWGYFLNAQVERRMEGTHSLRATLVYFKLLLEAFAANENNKGALWAGCLTHVIGDAAAANHPPLLMYLTYADGPLGMTVAPSNTRLSDELSWIDVAGPSQDELGRQFIREELTGYKPTLLGDNAEEAAIRLQLLLHENWLVALNQEAKIASGFEQWVGNRDEQGREKMLRGMAVIIARCTRDSADAIYTAHVLSRQNQTFDVDLALEKGQPSIAEHRRSLLLSEVSLYDGLLRESNAVPAIGVFIGVPPIYWVSSGCVDLQFCYFMALITRTLADQQTPYVTYDLKAPPESLDPAEVPIVILPPYRQADGLATDRLEKMLHTYREAGGRILCIGGYPSAAVDPLTDQMHRNPESDYFYPLKTQDMPGTQLILTDAVGQQRGKAIPILHILKDFDVRVYGGHVMKSNATAPVKPVVLLENGETRLPVSLGLAQGHGFEVIYAPWYFFMPGLLSDEREKKNLDHPTLDSQGTIILNHLLGLLKEDR
ncbi:MAG: hypothetical protein O3A29_12950 [Planctomycetota bacterium]|nr:hypothetical protein [Planctomycetota bacterium]